MSGGFESFAEAASKPAATAKPPAPLTLNRVAVLGGGEDARLIAALCLAAETKVTLFSAYGAELDMLRASSGISLRGAGPVGSYQVDRSDAPSVQTTAELDRAVAGADAIFLTGPVHKQRTYAMVLADHLSDGQILVLAPARSLGALETAWYLRIGGCTADVTIVEAQGLPYWITATGSQLHLSEAAPVAAATLPAGRLEAFNAVAKLLTNLSPCDSVLASGFADGSALVEIPSLLLSGPALSAGAINIPMGGQPLAENQTFASLIGPEHRAVIARLTSERHAVAKCFGVRNLPDADTWTANIAGALKGDGGRPIPNQATAKALLRDGVIGSFVPLLSAAKIAGIDAPVTQSMVTLASAVLGADVAAAGRRLDTIGITENDIDSARRAMDAIATGTR